MNESADKTNAYDDIIDLPHHVSQTRLPMSKSDRAAQFSPFKSLVGLDHVMSEIERQTVEKSELDEYEKSALDEKLRLLQGRISEHPEVFVVYFHPDPCKEGGSYCEISGSLRRIDPVEQQIIFDNGTTIPLSDIFALDME